MVCLKDVSDSLNPPDFRPTLKANDMGGTLKVAGYV